MWHLGCGGLVVALAALELDLKGFFQPKRFNDSTKREKINIAGVFNELQGKSVVLFILLNK